MFCFEKLLKIKEVQTSISGNKLQKDRDIHTSMMQFILKMDKYK